MIQADLKPSPFHHRILAAAADLFLISLVNFSLAAALGIDITKIKPDSTNVIAFLVFHLLDILFFVFYQVVFLVQFNGQSIGKRLMGMRVIAIDGKKVGLLQAVLRSIFSFASFSFVFGYLNILFSKKRQSWHDKIAQTMVVSTGEKKRIGIPIISLILIIAYSIFFIWKNIEQKKLSRSESSSGTQIESASEDESQCGYHNVAGLQMFGYLNTYHLSPQADEFGNVILTTSSDKLQEDLEVANNDPDVEAILLEIDSPGGLTVAAEELVSAIQHTNKPTITVIRGSGLSSAYWVASATDYIFAAKTSEVGSIGVNGSYVSEFESNEKEGLKYESITSGQYKDIGSPYKPLSDEDRELLKKSVLDVHKIFEQAIAENRGLKIEDVQKLSDGSSLIAHEALEAGLIDSIGTTYDSTVYIKNLISDEVEICWY